VKMWVNEILTQDTSRQRETMNGTISQLHKGGSTNRPSDQRPVVLLNSVYQLLNYVINERLKKNVEPANILEPGQGGDRQGRCVGINMQKVHFIQQEAWRQGKRVYRVDIDFKNAFNAMSQAALWQVTRMFTGILFLARRSKYHLSMYVSFIGLTLTKTSLTLINRTRLRTKGQSAGYPQAQIGITSNSFQRRAP